MIVQEARSDKPLAAATVELLTPKDALITTLVTKDGQVVPGQNQEIRIHLAARPADKASSGDRASPLDKATQDIKRLFR